MVKFFIGTPLRAALFAAAGCVVGCIIVALSVTSFSFGPALALGVRYRIP